MGLAGRGTGVEVVIPVCDKGIGALRSLTKNLALRRQEYDIALPPDQVLLEQVGKALDQSRAVPSLSRA